ncbi:MULTISPECIES: GntR family transcriptional regulator [Clostridium]|uniref:GntR family transcriptional regulator n=1 Tax=Clostridium TaxID=1485 RepID=UPI00069D9D3C|nr:MULTISPECIES: winged helix-turn-helix domain-containing protein [Clostridium]MCD2347636.1 winged helix-turn-helix domain-containing protein [Clostridium guangxiense]
MQIIIDKNSELSLIKQVYSQIKTMILEGKLQGEEKLPSTIRLSYDLKVSRNVILEAYEELMAEGYIESRAGAGTFVAKELYFKRSKYFRRSYSLWTFKCHFKIRIFNKFC